MLANSACNTALDWKLSPSANQKVLSSPLHPRTARLARQQHPTKFQDSENQAYYGRLLGRQCPEPPQEDWTGAMLVGAHRLEPTSGVHPAEKLDVEPGVGARVGFPECSPGKGASLCWEPLEAVRRDPNSTPGG